MWHLVPPNKVRSSSGCCRVFKTLMALFLHFLVFNSLIAQSFFVDSVLQQASRLEQKKQAQYLYEVADNHFEVNLQESRTLADNALKLARKQNDRPLQFQCLMLIGDLSLFLQEYNAADSLFLAALKLAESFADQKKVFSAKIALAKSLAFKSKSGSAIAVLDQVINEAQGANDSLVLARAFLAKGINLYRISAYEASLQNYYQALEIFSARGDLRRAGIVYENIGLTMVGLQRLDEALAAFEESRKISVQQQDRDGMFTTMVNIGVVYQKKGMFEMARKHYQQALEIAQQKGSWQDIALLTSNLGTTAMQTGNYPEAQALLDRTIHIQDSIRYYSNLPHSYNSRAELNIRMQNYEAALSDARDAERWARQISDLDQLSEALRLQATIYNSQGNHQLAYMLLSRHKKLNDSIFSLKSDEAISNLKIGYETMEKENEIARLAQENIISQRQKSILAALVLLVLISAAAIIYALYTRRHRDKMLLQKEQELHERQNQFFANISHEFRTPLALILGPAQNLKSQVTDKKGVQLINTIKRNAERLLFFINEILDLSRFDQQVVSLKREVIDIHLFFSGICASFTSLAQSRSIYYSYKISKNIYLYADRRRLEIVLINLFSNAFKFTPNGGKISVMVKPDSTLENLLILVKDTGPGIPEEDHSRIFDRYYHNDQKSKSAQEGIGIGLALSKSIVELHGGNIGVSSKPNAGSEFVVSLPLEILPHLPVSNEEVPVSETEIKPEVDRNPSIIKNEEKPLLLLIEDGDDMRKYLRHFLQEEFAVIEAPNADEGWTRALNETPDVVISDVMMPGKSGLEFCRQLKTDVRTSHIPVILLTAKAADEDRISGLETEADVYLTKPFIPEELLLNLHNILKSREKLRSHFTEHRKIEPAKMTFNSLDEQFLKRLQEQLEAHFSDDQFSVEKLADNLNMSRSQLHRKVRSLTGEAPTQLIRTFRLSRAREMINSHAATIAEISFAVGFASPAYFSKCFLEEFKATPTEIRDRS